MVQPDNSDLIAQLRSVSEVLTERSIAALRDAIDSGTGVRPPEEKVLSQARRAVDKAISLLGGAVTDG